MKILVTGGAGFIASHIVDAYIEAGHEVHIIEDFSTGRRENLNPKAKLYETDINDCDLFDILKAEKFDILNHHAAQMDVRISVKDPKLDAYTNVIGSLNLYEMARLTGIGKIIFASSGGTVYGEQEIYPADESHSTNPCSPYGIHKLVNEKYLFYYKELYGINFAILRYANIYGPRQNPHGEAGVVAIFINKMLAGAQPVINGDGLNTRDYVYVGDVVRANVMALSNDFTGTYNIGTGIESDVNFIFENVKRLIGSNVQKIHGEAKAGEQRRSVLSYNKIKNMHSWAPSVDFSEGLRLTVEHFKSIL